jgi:hypothetical protein
MGVNHGCLDIFMTQKFLHRTNVISIFEEMSGEAVSQGMRAGGFEDSGLPNCFFYRFLQD